MGDAFYIPITIVTKSFITLAYLIGSALASRTHGFTATGRVILVLAILVCLTLKYTLSLLHAHIDFWVAASGHALVAEFAIVLVCFHTRNTYEWLLTSIHTATFTEFTIVIYTALTLILALNDVISINIFQFPSYIIIFSYHLEFFYVNFNYLFNL